jgi:hypothetical protein
MKTLFASILLFICLHAGAQAATRTLVWEAGGTNQTKFVIYNGAAVFATVAYTNGVLTHRYQWVVAAIGLYTFTVKAANDFGESAPSNLVTLVALPPEAAKNVNIISP